MTEPYAPFPGETTIGEFPLIRDGTDQSCVVVHDPADGNRSIALCFYTLPTSGGNPKWGDRIWFSADDAIEIMEHLSMAVCMERDTKR